ncbi:MAG: NADH-ubiquinone oxidoreductase-F iron-sulfur binding region domain-containing protein [Planctomycetota bacterium]
MSTHILLTKDRAAGPQTFAEFRAEGGLLALETALAAAPEAVLAALESSGLRGRGGAGFPAAVKWRLAASQPGPDKYVLANGGEHEPGSDKDKHLVEHYPHKVLEGMVLCGFATGASRGYLYLIEDMAAPLAAAEHAIIELRDAGWLGADIGGRGFAFDIEIHRAPTTYVAGEETAALESVEGRPAKPRAKPPYPGESGLFGKPTTVNNVETFAHVPYLLRHGAAHYRSIGTADCPGTMLFTLGQQVLRPGVYELPFGSTFRQLLDGCGGGLRSGGEVRAILPALSCAWLGAEHLDAVMDRATLRDLGSSLGCGGVTFIESGDDVVARALDIAQFFMDEQCGLCPPCRMQTNQAVHVLRGVAAGKGPGYAEKLEKLTAFARGKGRCSLIEMAAAPLMSALRLFEADFARAAGGDAAP